MDVVIFSSGWCENPRRQRLFPLKEAWHMVSVCHGLYVCVPPDFYVEALTPHTKVFGWGSHDGIRDLLKRHTRELALSLCAPWAPSEKAGVCKPGSRFSPEPCQAGPLSLNFQHLELWENSCLLLQLPALVFCYGGQSWLWQCVCCWSISLITIIFGPI